jgi:hypothetical protein
MTSIIPGSPPDWQDENRFQEWRNKVFLGAAQQLTCHLLLSDESGLRGFLSYTPSDDNTDIHVNELQIRPSCRADGATFRRLVAELARRAATLPHSRLVTYANKANVKSQQLAERLGFRRRGETSRGYCYEMPK